MHICFVIYTCVIVDMRVVLFKVNTRPDMFFSIASGGKLLIAIWSLGDPINTEFTIGYVRVMLHRNDRICLWYF